MKLSNKLILGTVLLVMLVIFLHYAGIAFVHSKGWYTFKDEPAHYEYVVSYPENVKVIRISNCSDVRLYAADTFFYTNIPSMHFKTAMEGDTLVMAGSYSQIDTVHRKGKLLRIDTSDYNYSSEISIFLTGNEKIEGFDCRFTVLSPGIHETPETFKQLEILLDQSSFGIGSFPVHFKNLNIDALNMSNIRLTDGVIDTLQVTLQDRCTLQDNTSRINAGTVYYSDSSRIETDGGNLKALQMIYRKDVKQQEYPERKPSLTSAP